MPGSTTNYGFNKYTQVRMTKLLQITASLYLHKSNYYRYGPPANSAGLRHGGATLAETTVEPPPRLSQGLPSQRNATRPGSAMLLPLLVLCLPQVLGSAELELQGSTVTATGGGRVWVVTSSDAVSANSSVSVVAASPGAIRGPPPPPVAVASATIESTGPDGGLLLVAVPPGLAAAAFSLSFAGPDGGAVVSPAVNAPEPHWVTPRARHGDVVAVHGRRFRPASDASVLIAGAVRCTKTNRCKVAMHIENENRGTFLLPHGLAPGIYELQYSDSWGVWDGLESLKVEVLTPLCGTRPAVPHTGCRPVVNASLPPYSADPTGAADATPAIMAALLEAGSGGTVALGAGTFLLDRNTSAAAQPGTGCRTMAASICLPAVAPATLPVTLRGLGPGATTLRQGASVQNAFWGSAVSLIDLTLSDQLPAGQVPSVPAGSYQSPGLWSMDTYGAWAFNMTDLVFSNVHFVSSRNHSHALVLRYIRTVKITNCTFTYLLPDEHIRHKIHQFITAVLVHLVNYVLVGVGTAHSSFQGRYLTFSWQTALHACSRSAF